ncbi:MAG: peptidyl-prolyl cis-trans isomerase [Capnocytophaga sp.]|nr:peptidyl-prolyl cis-trans isomerase [Capnocytophaga sp.]
MKLKNIIGAFLVMLTVASCQYFVKKTPHHAVARVGEKYLYTEDLAAIMPSTYTPQDSLNIVRTYINNWAIRELMMQNAQRNIPDEEKADFERLVDEYRTDLYINLYKENLINRSIDTSVTAHEMALFYEKNKDIFTLNESLIKLRYILLPEKSKNQKKIEEKFRRFDLADQRELDSISLQFSSFHLNDSTWVKSESVFKRMPFLPSRLGNNRTLSVGRNDSLGYYMIEVTDYLKVTEQAPIEYVQPTLRKIILNQRKLEFIRKLDTDIISSGINKKQFEIYNKPTEIK